MDDVEKFISQIESLQEYLVDSIELNYDVWDKATFNWHKVYLKESIIVDR
jgi:hypothetical protein